MRRFLPIALAGAGAIAFAGGLLLGDARDDDPRPTLAAAGEPIPAGRSQLVALDEAGEPVPAGLDDPDVERAEGAAAPVAVLAPVAGSGAGGRTTLDRVFDQETGVESAAPADHPQPVGSPAEAPPANGDPTTTAAPRSAGTQVVSSLDDLAGGPDAVPFRFTDPCAGADPGGSPDGLPQDAEECPEGVGGLILLGDDLPDVPAIRINPMASTAVSPAEARCPTGVSPGGVVRTTVYTNVPASLTVTLDIRGEHHEVVVETSPEERLRFTGRVLDGEPVDSSQPHAVQHCVTLESIPRPFEHNADPARSYLDAAVRATDDLGNVATMDPLTIVVDDPDGNLDDDTQVEVDLTEYLASRPPLAVGVLFVDHVPPRQPSRCPVGLEDDGTLSGVFTSNGPGAFSLQLIHAGATVASAETATSESEYQVSAEDLAAGHPATTDWGPGSLHNCFSFPAVTEPGLYYLDITATSPFTGSDHARMPFTITDDMLAGTPTVTAGRPSAILLPDDQRVRVLLSIDGDQEDVRVRALPRTGPHATSETCTGVEPQVLGGGGMGPGAEAGPRVERHRILSFTPSEPGTDPERYDTIQVVDQYAGEGALIDLCTWVTTQARGDFDPTVQERRSFRIEAPRFLRTRIVFSVGAWPQPVPVGTWRVEALNWPGRPSGTFPDSPFPTQLGIYEIRDDLVLDSGGAAHPEVTHLRIHGPDGSVDTTIRTPNRCGGPSDCHDLGATVDLRAISASLPCRSRPCENPYGNTISLNAEPYESTGFTLTDRWVAEDRGSFDRAISTRPDVPRADLTLDTPQAASPGPGVRPVITLRLPFDRPVDVTVIPSLDGPVPATCAAPTQQRSPGAAADHTFRFAEACYGATYSFAVRATDPTTGATLELPGPAFAVRTPGLPVRSIRAEVVATASGRMTTSGLDVVVGLGADDLSLTSGGRPGCLDDGDARSATATRTGTAARPVAIGDRTPLTVDIRWRGCDLEVRSLRGGRDLTMADLLAGPVEYVLSGPGIQAHLTVTVAQS